MKSGKSVKPSFQVLCHSTSDFYLNLDLCHNTLTFSFEFITNVNGMIEKSFIKKIRETLRGFHEILNI